MLQIARIINVCAGLVVMGFAAIGLVYLIQGSIVDNDSKMGIGFDLLTGGTFYLCLLIAGWLFIRANFKKFKS